MSKTDKSKGLKAETAFKTDRRQFLKLGGAAALGLLAGSPLHGACASVPQSAPGAPSKPNFLLIMVDQMGLDAIAAHGCTDAHTPNIDRLVRRGVTFMESHSTNPICSPARSSLMTGRMPVETGVIQNDLFIHPAIPNMGTWFRNAGYETVYAGKWHLPYGYPHSIDGFSVIPSGGGEGDATDPIVSRSCAAYLKNRRGKDPFLLIASFHQPHDICSFGLNSRMLIPDEFPFPQLAGRLPALPPNNKVKTPEHKQHDVWTHPGFTDSQWRHYLYVYYRQVEMVDADIGRLLDALEDSGLADNTIILFTSDHGDGRGRHGHVGKWNPYDEAVKVPLVVSCPGRIAEGQRDVTHLVSAIDLMNTMCDYAAIAPPPDLPGKSLRPLLEQKSVVWRDSILIETRITGRVIRTGQYKYVAYKDDPIEEFYDMQADPWETKNLSGDSRYASAVEDHKKLLREWEGRLKPNPSVPKGTWSAFGALWTEPGVRLFSE